MSRSIVIKTVMLITMESGVCEGQVKHNLFNYKSFGEYMYIIIKNHGNKIAHVSKKLLFEIITESVLTKSIICL